MFLHNDRPNELLNPHRSVSIFSFKYGQFNWTTNTVVLVNGNTARDGHFVSNDPATLCCSNKKLRAAFGPRIVIFTIP